MYSRSGRRLWPPSGRAGVLSLRYAGFMIYMVRHSIRAEDSGHCPT